MAMVELVGAIDLSLLAAIFAGLVMFGLIFYFWQSRSEARARAEVRKRLDISSRGANRAGSNAPSAKKAAGAFANRIASRTNNYYSANDPTQQRKMQMRLIRAGFPQKGALGYFLAARLGLGAIMLLVAVGVVFTFMPEKEMTHKALMIMLGAAGGYFFPNFIINKRITEREAENRRGFPDVMDLMVVSSEAGLTIEASIERIAHEISRTYPILSEQLQVASIEVRAGKSLDEALRTFGERVGLEEVQGFATMIQQSKELGTSVSDALRVYSDEMRHRRMMAAEEKAYALPAKLSVPVTAFILPIVIGVAIIPTIVRLMTQ